MPIVPHDKKIEPSDEEDVWRFLRMTFFRDLMANEELYFRRNDLYKNDDPNEGLPTDNYIRRQRNLESYVLEDELTLNHIQGSNRLLSESAYISCWNLCDPGNALRMRYRYAPYGVAVSSKYGLLKSALDKMPDDVCLGKVRYGDLDMTRFNRLQFLYTKGCSFSWENEIPAVIFSYDPVGGQARNYRETNFPYREPQDDLNPRHPWVHDCKRRRVYLNELITGIAVSPWATDKAFQEVQESWANIRGHKLPVGYDMRSALTPTISELKLRGWRDPGAE